MKKKKAVKIINEAQGDAQSHRIIDGILGDIDKEDIRNIECIGSLTATNGGGFVMTTRESVVKDLLGLILSRSDAFVYAFVLNIGDSAIYGMHSTAQGLVDIILVNAGFQALRNQPEKYMRLIEKLDTAIKAEKAMMLSSPTIY